MIFSNWDSALQWAVFAHPKGRVVSFEKLDYERFQFIGLDSLIGETGPSHVVVGMKSPVTFLESYHVPNGVVSDWLLNEDGTAILYLTSDRDAMRQIKSLLGLSSDVHILKVLDDLSEIVPHILKALSDNESKMYDEGLETLANLCQVLNYPDESGESE